MWVVSHNLEPAPGYMHAPAVSQEREEVLLVKFKISRRVQELSLNTCLSLYAFLMWGGISTQGLKHMSLPINYALTRHPA